MIYPFTPLNNNLLVSQYFYEKKDEMFNDTSLYIVYYDLL